MQLTVTARMEARAFLKRPALSTLCGSGTVEGGSGTVEGGSGTVEGGSGTPCFWLVNDMQGAQGAGRSWLTE